MTSPHIELSTPLRLPSGVIVPNRLAKAAMSECLGDARNSPTAAHPSLYERWARGGAGLMITGNVMVDRRAIGEAGNVAVEDGRDLPALRRWATAAKGQGGVALAQLNHPGRQVLAMVTQRPVAPSAVRVKGAAGVFRTPRALTAPEIQEVIRRFATTASVMVDAGFDGVEIHAAHGYLLNQFLSPLTNHRRDAWGGDIEGRSRLLIEVVRAVRASIGPNAVLAVKLNSADFQRGGFDEDDAHAVARMLDHEQIDLLEISGGTYESTAYMGVPATTPKASTLAREAYFLEFAENIRENVSVPLMVSGGFRTAEGMRSALRNGATDLIGLGRPLALEPDLPARLLDGTATSSVVEPRRLGIRRFDGSTDLVWHTAQLQRMGHGRDPRPDRHPVMTLAEYTWHIAPYLWTRFAGGSR